MLAISPTMRSRTEKHVKGLQEGTWSSVCFMVDAVGCCMDTRPVSHCSLSVAGRVGGSWVSAELDSGTCLWSKGAYIQ